MSGICERGRHIDRQELAMPRDARELFHVAAGLAACLIAAGLYRLFGFFGVGLLGMLILFGATSVDLQDWHGGGMNAGLYSPRVTDDERFTRNERAGWKSERQNRRRATDYALMVGLAFFVVGGAGFLFFDLHLGR
jgi:hypothetical protein